MLLSVIDKLPTTKCFHSEISGFVLIWSRVTNNAVRVISSLSLIAIFGLSASFCFKHGEVNDESWPSYIVPLMNSI